MSLRPVSAKWFELVTVHKELARVMECLSQTGAVELEARSRPTERVLFPGLDEELKSCRELARRYQHYWPAPAPAPAPQRRTEELSETLKAARARLEGWANEADPIILIIEKLSQNVVDLAQLRAALESAGDNFPDIHALNRAGPKLRARLFALPAEAQWQEVPALVLIKRWQTADASYVLAVGPAFDVDDVETRLRGLKARRSAAAVLAAGIGERGRDATAFSLPDSPSSARRRPRNCKRSQKSSRLRRRSPTSP